MAVFLLPYKIIDLDPDLPIRVQKNFEELERFLGTLQGSGLKISNSSGITSTRSDNMARASYNSDGIKIQKYNIASSQWEDTFYVDAEGRLNLVDIAATGSISATQQGKAQVVIDPSGDNLFAIRKWNGSSWDNKIWTDSNGNVNFSEDIVLEFQGPEGPQGPQGPQGIPGSYYAPGWIGATTINFNSIQSPSGYFNRLALGQSDAASIILQGGKTDGSIRSAIFGGGKSTYGSTTAGFWMGDDGGTWKYKVGNASNYLDWNGSSLTIAGALVQTSTSGARIEITDDNEFNVKNSSGYNIIQLDPNYYDIDNIYGMSLNSRSNGTSIGLYGAAVVDGAGTRRTKEFLVMFGDNKDCFIQAGATVIAAYDSGYIGIMPWSSRAYVSNYSEFGISSGIPGSMWTIVGNCSVGSNYKLISAPSNGLIVEGSVGIGYSDPGAYKLKVNGSVYFSTGASGMFDSEDGKTVTVTNGIVTSIN